MKITTNTTICIEEQQIRILEFFREYWGIQQINEVIANSILCVNKKITSVTFPGPIIT